MLRLTYTRARDEHQRVSVLGDPPAIRDLYWQLTHNYRPVDGTAIGDIKIFDLFGTEVKVERLMTAPWGSCPAVTVLD